MSNAPGGGSPRFCFESVKPMGHRRSRCRGRSISVMIATNSTCDFERASAKYVAVNIPTSADLRMVVSYLLERKVEWEHADPTYDEFHATS